MTEMTYFARQCYSVTRGSIPQSVVNSAVDEWKARLRAYVKCKGKGPSTCYSATYMSQTRDQQRFTILEVAADWHEPMVPQRIM